ncbi:probable methyltransferase At1g29790 [Zingiber officinale]|uniref:Methyltransferase type 11 domain-containing protein n=1 Tax=Zingiber officinale TaxID=94328 RepID=A0A8J5KSZ9_ZINOF|nr:probable methyltransferase At1g29790 [Zingiber officinale]KAG6491630.1 hypothetical protein ZIOFF_046565 [Zingiber officinale]
MGIIKDEHRRLKPSHAQSPMTSKLKILLVVVSTNLLSVFLFAGSSAWVAPAVHFVDSGTLLRELNATQRQLSNTLWQVSQLSKLLATANSLLETTLTDIGKAHREDEEESPDEDLEKWARRLTGELKLVVGPHKFPLGYNPNIGSDELYPVLGTSCRRYEEELVKYMSYEVGGECPSDEWFAQRLMLKGCEPLPRRRCHPKSPVGYVEPAPLPESLWAIPADTSITWDAYTCKNYSCLVNRGKAQGSYDCKDCFDLSGREKHRWLHDNGELDYAMDEVLAMKPAGTIRVGLDIGGGSGTFAARMWERNVTVVTSSMNFDGPFNNFIASRGLVAMHISVAHRLPFYDNTLDLVHSMHVLSNWIPDAMLEFALFDIYRVLRPGGVFWLDHFFCLGHQLNATYAPMFDRIGFRKLRWNAGRKLDRGIEKNEWYISTLLEKPMT